MDLPIALALIASYLQKEIPRNHYFLGEVDLLRKVRPLPADVTQDFVNAIADGSLRVPLRVICPAETANQLRGVADEITVIDVAMLDDAVFFTWPELREVSS